VANTDTAAPATAWLQPLAYLAAAVAILFGLWARFKGLGSYPFTVDEYYLSRSIDNVLRTGLPAFSCGGYYVRGLALQYLAAGLRTAGLSAELAPRLICAISSVLALPAAYILGRRMHGHVVGVLVAVILALSVWEIEIGRFGRMYAPFQTVFVWYLVFFVRYTIDRDVKALWPMLALSVAGPLVWEGGVFLTLTNLLPVFLQRWPGRVPKKDWTYVAFGLLLLALAYWFVTADFRGYNSSSWPAGYSPSLEEAPPDHVAALPAPLHLLPRHLIWCALAVMPVAASVFALRWIWTWRSRPFAALGLLAMLGAALLHQFTPVLAIATLLLLARVMTWRELFRRAALPFHLALACAAVFWLAFGIATVDWQSAEVGSVARGVAMLAYQFLRVPNFVGVVVRPWVKAVPHLGAGLLLLSSIAVYRMAKSAEPLTIERALLAIFLLMLLAASASHPPMQETRYVFFLYPLAVIIAVTTLARAATLINSKPALAAGVTSLMALGGFALSEDFQPGHLLHIGSPAEAFRINMNEDMASHLVLRADYRAVARWLQQNASGGKAMVINGVHALDYYYPEISYFYVDEADPNFSQWACRRGTVERWGNYPLLVSVDAIARAIAGRPRVYLVIFGYYRDRIILSLAALHAKLAYSQQAITILELHE
jgi:uncharacterized membrane protein SirB2